MSLLTTIRKLVGNLLEVDVATVRGSRGTDERANGEAVGISINSKESGEASASGGIALFEKTSVFLLSLVTSTGVCEEMKCVPRHSKCQTSRSRTHCQLQS
jgi:hypothetical protein